MLFLHTGSFKLIPTVSVLCCDSWSDSAAFLARDPCLKLSLGDSDCNDEAFSKYTGGKKRLRLNRGKTPK